MGSRGSGASNDQGGYCASGAHGLREIDGHRRKVFVLPEYTTTHEQEDLQETEREEVAQKRVEAEYPQPTINYNSEAMGHMTVEYRRVNHLPPNFKRLGARTARWSDKGRLPHSGLNSTRYWPPRTEMCLSSRT